MKRALIALGVLASSATAQNAHSAPCAIRDEPLILTVEDIERATRVLAADLRRGKIAPSAATLLHRARRAARREDWLRSVALLEASARFGAHRGSHHAIGVADRELMALGLASAMRWHLLERARRHSEDWMLRLASELAPDRRHTLVVADPVSRFAAARSHARQAAAAGQKTEAQRLLRLADRHLERAAVAPERHVLFVRGLQLAVRSIEAELGSRNLGSKGLGTANGSKRAAELEPGCLVTMVEGTPSAAPSARSVARSGSRHAASLPLFVRFENEATEARGASADRVLACLSAWIVTERPGLHRVTFTVDDGAQVFVDHGLLAETWSGRDYSSPRQAELMLTNSPALLEIVAYDFAAGLGITFHLERWNGTSWVPATDASLGLDPDMAERAGLDRR